MGGFLNFPGYNPQQHATLGLANQIGALLNGTVMQTNPSGPIAPPPQYAVAPTSGTDPRNAGLLAQQLAGGVSGQNMLRAEEAYLRNPAQYSMGPSQMQALQAQLAKATTPQDRFLIQSNINKLLGQPPPAPQTGPPPPNPSFAAAPGGHQAIAGPSFSPQQIASASQSFAPQPPVSTLPLVPAPPAAAPVIPPTGEGGGVSLADLGALLGGAMGGGGANINVPNPASYSPGVGAAFQPLQSMFANPEYRRGQPAALSSYLGRPRGY